MSSYQKGMNYEDFVETVYGAILQAEARSSDIKPVSIERRKRITSKSGTKGEIDIYWEYAMAGLTTAVAIECRNLNKKVGISGVRDFARKISDISGLKGLMVSPLGFTKPAIAEAQADQIDLIVIREQQDHDWDGYLKTIHINLELFIPARAVGLRPFLNQEWALANGFSKGSDVMLSTRNDLLILEDRSTGFRTSLFELESCDFNEGKGSGKHTWEKVFEDGWMITPEDAYHIERIQIDYLKSESISQGSIIDFEEYILAIMDWVTGRKGKTTVLKDGRVQG